MLTSMNITCTNQSNLGQSCKGVRTHAIINVVDTGSCLLDDTVIAFFHDRRGLFPVDKFFCGKIK